jgi:hypothetical protein
MISPIIPSSLIPNVDDNESFNIFSPKENVELDLDRKRMFTHNTPKDRGVLAGLTRDEDTLIPFADHVRKPKIKNPTINDYDFDVSFRRKEYDVSVHRKEIDDDEFPFDPRPPFGEMYKS